MFCKLLIAALLSSLVSVTNSNHLQGELETWMNLLDLQTVISNCSCQSEDPPKLSFSHIEHSSKNIASGIVQGILDDLKNQVENGIFGGTFGNDTTHLELRNFSLTGLDTMAYTVGGGTRGQYSLTLNLQIEKVDLNSWYRLDETDLGILVLYGEGDATISLQDINFILDVTSNSSSAGIRVDTVNNLVVSVTNSSVHLGGLLNNDEAGQLLNNIINDMIGYILDAIANDITAHITDGTCFPFLESSLDVQCITRWVVGTIYCIVLDAASPLPLKCADSPPKPYF